MQTGTATFLFWASKQGILWMQNEKENVKQTQSSPDDFMRRACSRRFSNFHLQYSDSLIPMPCPQLLPTSNIYSNLKGQSFLWKRFILFHFLSSNPKSAPIGLKLDPNPISCRGRIVPVFKGAGHKFPFKPDDPARPMVMYHNHFLKSVET